MDALDQDPELRQVAQRIQHRIDLQQDDPGVALVASLLKPRQRGVAIPQHQLQCRQLVAGQTHQPALLELALQRARLFCVARRRESPGEHGLHEGSLLDQLNCPTLRRDRLVEAVTVDVGDRQAPVSDEHTGLELDGFAAELELLLVLAGQGVDETGEVRGDERERIELARPGDLAPRPARISRDRQQQGVPLPGGRRVRGELDGAPDGQLGSRQFQS